MLLNDEQIINKVETFIFDQSTAHSNFLDMERKAFLLYMAGRKKEESKKPWPGASDLDIGGLMVMSHVESIHARAMFALQKANPIATFKSENREEAVSAQTYLDYKLNNEVNIMTYVDKWWRDSLISGARRAYVAWEKQTRRVAEEWRIPIPPQLEELSITDEHIKVLLLSRLGERFKIFKVLKEGKEAWKISYKTDETEREAILKWKVKKDYILATITYVKVVRSGPKLYSVNPEDFWKTDGPIQTCTMIVRRVWYQWPEILDMVESGDYENIDISDESEDKVKYSQRAIQSEQGASNTQARDMVAGVDPSNMYEKDYEFLVCHILDDFSGDGILEDREITIFRNAKKIVKNKYNTLRNSDGVTYRPISEIIVQHIPGKDGYGIGVPMMIYDAANEETAIHNLIIDAATFAVVKPFFYPDGIEIKPEQMRMVPGGGIPVPTTNGKVSDSIFVPQFDANLQPLMAMQQRIDQVTQSVDGVGETQLMRKPSAKTLGQSAMNQNELNIRFQLVFQRLVGDLADMSGLCGLVKIISDMYRQYGDDIDIMAATGKTVKKKTIAFPETTKMLMTISIDISKINEQQEMSKAQQIYQMVMNPMMLQLGVSTPGNIYNAAKKLLIALNETDEGEYISQPPQDQMKGMDANKENILLMKGVKVDVHPGDNDDEHIMSHTIMKNAVASHPEVVVDQTAYDMHIQAHQQQKQMKMQAQAKMQAQGGMGMGGGAPMVQGMGAQGNQQQQPNPQAETQGYVNASSG